MKSIKNIVLLGMLVVLGACSASKENDLLELNKQLFAKGIKGTYTTDTTEWATFATAMGSTVSTTPQTVTLSGKFDFKVPVTDGDITFTFQSTETGPDNALWGIYKVVSPTTTKYMGITLGITSNGRYLVHSIIKDTLGEVKITPIGVDNTLFLKQTSTRDIQTTQDNSTSLKAIIFNN